MIIGTAVDSSIRLAHQQTRQRDIDAVSHRLASGRKLDQVSRDGGAYRFTTRLDNQIRVDQAAADNLHNAISFIQTQSDGLRSVEQVLSRMDELALRAADPTLTSVDRDRYQSEFSALQTHLSYMGGEQFNGTSLYDPLASKYADVVPVDGASDGGWEPQEQIVDIGALSGAIRLWWNSTWQTDRLKVYQGASLLFDSGEYRSQHWLNFPFYEDHPDPAYQVPAEMNGLADFFQIDFSPGSVTVTPDSGNVGVSLHDKDAFSDLKNKTTDFEWFVYGGDTGWQDRIAPFQTTEDYPKSFPPSGESTQIRFVVNEDAGGAPAPRQAGSTTVWSYSAEIAKAPLASKSVLKGADGSMIEIQNIGFASLAELSIDTVQGASSALGRISLEQENLSYQQGVIGAEIARYRSQADILESKAVIEARTVSKIADTDLAEETTRLAKKLILQDANIAILAQSRVATANVYKTLL